MLQRRHGGAQCLNIVFLHFRNLRAAVRPNSFSKARLFLALRASDQPEERASG
jgi:hypothetical protein